MCGITGWIDWEKDLTQQGAMIQQMADTLSHRGPDAQGQWPTTGTATVGGWGGPCQAKKCAPAEPTNGKASIANQQVKGKCQDQSGISHLLIWHANAH